MDQVDRGKLKKKKKRRANFEENKEDDDDEGRKKPWEKSEMFGYPSDFHFGKRKRKCTQSEMIRK